MKNSLARFFFLAVVFPAVTACEKFEELNDTVVEGQVLDVTTNEPIPFAEVELNAMYLNVSYPAYNSFIKSAKADAKGKFSLSFDPQEDNDYAITCEMPGKYYPVADLFLIAGVKNKNCKLMLQPLAYVNVRFINEPPRDVAEIQWPEYHRPMLLQTWITDDFDWLLEIDANKPVDINCWVGKNGNSPVLHSKTVTVAPFDTITAMEIRY